MILFYHVLVSLAMCNYIDINECKLYNVIEGGKLMNIEENNLEYLLNNNKTIQVYPQGYSMYPFIKPHQDAVILKKVNYQTLKRGDVVLFQRGTGLYVLHRIYKIKNQQFFLVGDNQIDIEGPILSTQIKAKMIAIKKKNKIIDVNNIIYFIIAQLWLLLRPLRHFIVYPFVYLKRLFHTKS